MTTRYRWAPGRSLFRVQAFASGMLSFLGHSPTFAVRNLAGSLWFVAGTLANAGGELIVRADSLELLDRVNPRDRQEIEERMRRDVLETGAFPEILFQADEVSSGPSAGNRYRARVVGRLSLHGVTARHAVDADVLVYDDGVRVAGESVLRMSDYRIRPVTALGGAIQLRDLLRLTFDLAALNSGEEGA